MSATPNVGLGWNGDELGRRLSSLGVSVLALLISLGALVRARLPGGQLIHPADSHHPRDEASGGPSSDESVDAGAKADTHGVSNDGAIDHIKDRVMEASQRAAPQTADTASRDGRAGLCHKVFGINMSGTLRPDER